MRCTRVGLVVAGLLMGIAVPLRAQAMAPGPGLAIARFESWQPALRQHEAGHTLAPIAAAPRNRTRRALLGGAIGAVVGVASCTVISTLADDSADGGISFCPLDTNLLMGGAGFLLGAAVGWLL
jgi:hypothetical protein